MRGASLSNRALGEKIGVTEHQVWRWRKGRTQPSDRYLMALAEALDVSVASFYEEPTEKAA
jgi:transcriptional regulator with XRE-family HTH domain